MFVEKKHQYIDHWYN